ncbi:5'-3'-deoxyribonucleotidase [Candidatus Pacearchaeota archaeon]|nr:5'-3'-deoxyribonucleotidase [Candidatus Pacearchaeota archaeon]MBD3283790.1 5'-3'-deoxyribonucleotidase [Candidatus Pacearchaeota archaeon]
MIILVDMDGVIADFETGLLNRFKETHPDKQYVPLEKRTNFYVDEDYPEEMRNLLREIYRGKGFYFSLPPVPGSLEVLTELQSQEEVFICTSPLSIYEHCVPEKYQWVDHYLGKSWVRRLILTKDKTVVRGDILIDDRPEVTGITSPSWEHVLYSQPYNQQVSSKRRLTWQDWREVLKC